MPKSCPMTPKLTPLTSVTPTVALEAVEGADVLLIATEWPEFAMVDLAAVASRMRGHRIVDARNLLDPKAVRAAGLDYWGLGRPSA